MQTRGERKEESGEVKLSLPSELPAVNVWWEQNWKQVYAGKVNQE